MRAPFMGALVKMYLGLWQRLGATACSFPET